MIKIKSMHILSLMLVVLASYSCGSEADEQPAVDNSNTRNVPIVLVTSPQNRIFEGQLNITGTAKAYQEVKLYAMIGGFLQSIYVDIGDFVKQGQVIAILENPELFQQRAIIKAELKAKKSIYERLSNIYQKTPDLTTITDVENTQAEYESLKAKFDALQTQISYLKVKTPFSGVITNRYVDKGAALQSGLNNSNAVPIVEILDIVTIRLECDVPETDVNLINEKTVADITFPELPEGKFTRTVSRIAYGLNPNSKTMKIEIDLPNKNYKIRPGMYAKIQINFKNRSEALSVPNEAIGNVKGQSFVYEIVNGKAEKVNVQLGLSNAEFSEIISDDISLSDKIVIQGKEGITDGSIVKVKERGQNGN